VHLSPDFRNLSSTGNGQGKSGASEGPGLVHFVWPATKLLRNSASWRGNLHGLHRGMTGWHGQVGVGDRCRSKRWTWNGVEGRRWKNGRENLDCQARLMIFSLDSKQRKTYHLERDRFRLFAYDYFLFNKRRSRSP